MMMRSLILPACLALGIAAPAFAKPDISSDFRQVQAGEPLELKPDRAYVLLRFDTSISKFSADILRIPEKTEIEAYEAAKQAAHAKAGDKAGPLESFAFVYEGRPNFYELTAKKPIVSAGKTATVLAELPPGDYIFYGEGFAGFLYQCFCLGTVGFTAPAGQVTDLGTMIVARAADPSPIAELAGEIDQGPSALMDYVLWAIALRPQRAGEDVPAGLDPARTLPARFRAIGPFVDPNTLLISRLAAIPGVLAYDGGRVIDVATGAEAPPN
ncbi:hypothetical protein [Sphingomonas colocasiae]|uniref:Uncharacterized protein n=1 Tax=Sphingomonas colocasiae TaxID=1848973 RepID=A0ABS7PMJ9_9SPHN|nr:hypothetical protein [Sphingomonas colocasiae]MBY8822501.1 hypothetical protein [Sphingomonas colocasiae]